MVEIDIGGPDGNAFVLLGIAKRYAEQLGMEYDPIKKDMTSGDYDHLCNVFEREFGHVATLYNSNDEEGEE